MTKITLTQANRISTTNCRKLGPNEFNAIAKNTDETGSTWQVVARVTRHAAVRLYCETQATNRCIGTAKSKKEAETMIHEFWLNDENYIGHPARIARLEQIRREMAAEVAR